jgi:fibronectin-binding autotransporter adhesin
MKIKSLAVTLLGSVLLLLSLSSAQAQTTIWTDGANATDPGSWSDDANWADSLTTPTVHQSPLTIGSSAVVEIGVLPASGGIAVDTGGPAAIASLMFDNTLTGSTQIGSAGNETLQINGPITNASGFNQNLKLQIIAGANALFTGGTHGLTFGNTLTVGLNQITTSGVVNLNAQVDFTINSNSAGGFGTIGPVTTGAMTTISVAGSYTGAQGDFFKLTTGNFAGATITNDPTNAPGNPSATLPTLSAGLVWVPTLIQKGILIVQNTSGNLIKAGVTLPIGADAEFNTGGITLSGGELATSDSGPLDNGAPTGVAFTTARPILVSSTGTIAAAAGSTATYNSSAIISGSSGTLTFGDATNTGTVILDAANTLTGTYAVADGTLDLVGSTLTGSTVAVGTAGTLSGAGTVGGNATLTGGGIIDFTNPGHIVGTLGITGGNWTGAGMVNGQITQTSGLFTIGSGATLTSPTGFLVTGGSIAAGGNTSTLNSSLTYQSSSASTFQGMISGANHTVTVNNAAANLTLSGGNTYTGATSIAAGTLTINGTTVMASSVDVGSASSTLAGIGMVNGNVTIEGGTINMTGGQIGGTLTANGGATIDGTETVAGQVRSNNNAFTIGSGADLTATTGVTIAGGTLGAADGSSTITGNVNYTSGSNSTFAGMIAGLGKTLTMNKAGSILTLTGANTYTGATTITAGTLAVNGSLAGSPVTIASGAALAGSGTVGGTTTANSATVNGAGLTLTGLTTFNGSGNTLSGAETALGGISVSSGAALAQSGNLTGNLATSGTATITGPVIGTATVNSGGTLAGSGTVSGTTTISGGTVNGSGLGLTLIGLVTFSGTGNTLSGTENAQNGIALGGTSTVSQTGGTLKGSVSDTSSGSSTFAGVIADLAGPSSVLVNSAGATVTLSGANTYTGATSVTAGKLVVTGSTAAGSTVTVGSSGILAGTGMINGPLMVSPSGILAPGTTAGTAGTLHVGNLGLTIGNGSALDIDLAAATTVGAGVNDLVNLTGGTLTFGGQTIVDINALGTLTTGTAYTLINGAATVSNFNAANFTANGLAPNTTAAFSLVGNALEVTLSTNSLTNYFYTGLDNFNPTVFNIPDNYNTTASGTTAQMVALGPTSNVFIGATSPTPTGTSLALNASVSINSLTFTSTGAGGFVTGPFTLTVGSGGVTVQPNLAGTETFTTAVALGATQAWTVNTGSTLLDSAGISQNGGTFGLTKAGAGTLELGASDTYTGATVVSAGALDVQNNAGLGGTSSVTVTATGAALQLSGVITSTAVPLTLNGTGLSGSGALDGISGLNTYSGSITLGSNTTIGSESVLNLSGATLTGSGFNLTLTGGGTGTVSGAIGTGAGTLTKAGAGTWTLSGANTFTGSTTISSGTLALGVGGSLAHSSGVSLGSNTAIFDITAGDQTIQSLSGVGFTTSHVELGIHKLTVGTGNTSTTFDGIIEGPGGGSLTKVGTGVLTLSGANSYTGGTTINAGKVSVASVPTSLGAGTITLGGGELLTTGASSASNTGTLNAGANVIAAAAATTATYSGIIGGSGSVTLGEGANTGTVIFTADDNYVGTTTIAASTTAQFGATGTTGTAGTGNIIDNGVAVFNHTNNITVANAISGSGRVVQSGSGTTTLTGANGYAGGTTISGGALSVANLATNIGTGNITIGGGELITTATTSTAKTVTLTAGTDTLAAATSATYSGVISGTALTVGDGTNIGTVVLNATNTYIGGTTVSGGTLQIGTGSTTGSVTGNIVNNSAVVFDHSGTFTYGGAISGAGTVNSVTGTLNLTGTNTYGGATTITAGTLELSGTGSIANSAVTVGAGTTLAALGTTNGVGGLTVNSGAVTLLNSASNTLAGSTLTVAAGGGTLSIDVGATVGTSDLINLSGAASFGATPLVVNVASLGNAAVGTQYTFLTAAGGGLSAADFTPGMLTGSLAAAGNTVTFGISGNSAFLQINGAPVANYFYTGAAADNNFLNMANYNTLASGGVMQTTALSSASNVFIGTTNPTPTHLNPITLGTSQAINTLTFTPKGSGAVLNATGGAVLTVGSAVTVQTGVAGTETISAPVALGSSQMWTVTDAGSTLVDSGGISGAFALTKGGAGTLVLSGVDTYTGPTAINTGVVNLQNSGALNGTSGVTVIGGAALQLQDGITTAAAPLVLSGTGVSGKGALENVGGVNNYAGLITLAAATTIGSDAGTLNLTNVGTIVGNGLALTLTGGGNGSVAGIIGTGAGGLTKSGAGTWTLNGANTFAGATTINAGTLALGAASTTILANSSGVNVAALGTFDISAGNQTIKDLTGAGLVTLGASNLTLGTANSTTFAGVIAGSGGSLTKTGAGTLTLSGVNTYSGGTAINGGVVKVAAVDTNLGTGNLALGGGKLLTTTTSATGKTVTLNAGTDTLAAATSTTATYNGAIGGGGSLTLGDGTNNGAVVLTGTNAYAAAHIISGTVVAGSATALGAGDVSFSGGTLETGNGQNQINVAGNYTQTGGTLVLNLSGTTAGANPGYEFLHVTGTAALGGALQVVVSPMFVPMAGDMFTFVQAAGITGAFNSVSSNLFSLQISQQGEGMISINQLPFATLHVGYTPNELAVANYVDAGFQSGAASPAFQTLVASLNALTAGGLSPSLLPDAFSQLSPEKFANFVRSTTFDNLAFTTQEMDIYFDSQRAIDGNFISSNGQIDSSNLTVAGSDVDPNLAQVSSRLLAWTPAPVAHGLLSDVPDPVLGGVELRDAKEMKAAAPVQDHPISTFIMGNVVLGQNFSQEDLAHSDTTSGQVQIGADYRITPHLRVGALFGYSHTDADLDNNNSKATIDSYAPGVYASFADQGWYVNAVGTYGFNSYTEDRSVAFGEIAGVAHGAPSGDQIVGNLDGGYDFHVSNWTLGPTLGLQYAHLDVDSYMEDGLDPADLSVAKQEADSLRSRLGGHVSYIYHMGTVILTPHLDASWQHEFLDQSQGINAQIVSLGGTPFSVRTPNPSRDSALIDVGLTADLNGQVTLFGDYAVQAGQINYFGQSVQGGVKVGF